MNNFNSKRLARGSITIIDYNDAASISSFIESNKPKTVIYADSSRSTEWSDTAPLILTPVIYVSSAKTHAENQARFMGSVTWYYKHSGASKEEWTEITFSEEGTSEDKRFSLNLSGKDKFQLEVRCDGIEGVTSLLNEKDTIVEFKYVGIYTDVAGMSTPVGNTIDFSLIKSGTDKSASVAFTPDGNIFIKNGGEEVLEKRAIIELWKGSVVDFSDVDFRWYLQKDGVFEPMTLRTTTKENAKLLTITEDSWDPIVEVGSQFQLTTSTEDWNPALPKLQPEIYVVTKVDSRSKQITIALLSDNESGISSIQNSGTKLVSRWYDYRQGRGWARIKATSKEEAVKEALATDGRTGLYLGEMDTSSMPKGEQVTNCTGSNVLMVPPEAVLGLETFKGVAYDLDPLMTGGLPFLARPQIISFIDHTGPYQITLHSNQGNIIRNGKGFIKVETEVRHGGVLLNNTDKGKLFFDWSLYDNKGDQVSKFTHGNKNDDNAIRGYGRSTYEVATPIVGIDGETLEVVPKFDTAYVSKGDITTQGNIECEISIR